MAERAFAIRQGTEADVPAIVQLLKASLAWGAVPRTEEFWTWKHRRIPFGSSPFWVAESGAEIIGVRVFMRWQWTTSHGTVEAVRAVDTATHPDFQGQGIFRKLTLHGVEQLTRQGVAFVFNTPNEKSRPGYLKMGWRTVGRMSLWVAPRRPSAVARVALARLRRVQMPSQPEREDSTEAGLGELLVSGKVDHLLSSPQAFDESYRTRLDAAYLNWRYVECPAFRYAATLGDRGRVLVIHRVRVRFGAREVAICEVLFDQERTSVSAAAETVRGVLRRRAADYGVVAPPSDARTAAIFALAGFLPAPRAGPLLTVRPMASVEGVPDPLARRSWKASLGAFELF